MIGRITKMNLLKRLFGITEIKQVDEDELIREKNVLMSKLPLYNQFNANELWNSSYLEFRMNKISKHKKFYPIEGLFYANVKLERYIKRLK